MGTVDGEIASEERGEPGFSFDPVFLYPPAGRTFAEMTPDEKNRVSHRAIAAAGLVAEFAAAPGFIRRRKTARSSTGPSRSGGAPRRTRTFNQLIKSQLLYH